MRKKTYKKLKKEGPQGIRKDLHSAVLSIWDSNVGKAYNLKQMARLLAIKNGPLVADIQATVAELAEDNRVIELKNRRYIKAQNHKQIIGRVDHVSPYHAYIVVEGKENDIYVKTDNLMSAVHGDTVEVLPFQARKRARLEGRVMHIVARKRHRFVGRVVERSHRHCFVVPDFRKLYYDFFIPKGKTHQATTDDKVIVEVIKWGSRRHNPEAEIIKILGKTGSNEAEMHSIMSEFELPFCFSPALLQEAEKIKEEIPQDEIKKRKDFRDTLTFTIDPDDAKDFDDAISFKKLHNGNYEIGVHIADVAHYVRPDTQLDCDAYNRATSVYLVDRTVPMLPERLSNHLCSLRPKEDKLSFSVVWEVDAGATIHKEWFGKTIIHSDYRFTYEQAQQAIEALDGICAEELKTLNNIARLLRKKRIDNGAMDLETVEIKFLLDDDKKPVAAIPKKRGEAHKLIEEFMLLANKAVASCLFKHTTKENKNTAIYRTHDSPDPEKVMDFARFVKQFGHSINTEEKTVAHAINKLMHKIEGKLEQNILQQLAIRTMAKATYSTEAKGHFGLAFPHYTHFTSPIRRYPDLIAHRMLERHLNGGFSLNKKEYETKCAHCSEREKRAVNAERASVKYKQVEFMSTAIDKVYEGIITGVSDFGIFIEITETRCEGMAKLQDMKNDYYELDEGNFRVIGRKKKKIYRLGDVVHVRVKKTDIDRRIIDLTLVE